MSDIRDPRLLWFKFGSFVCLGLLASAIALVLFPSLKLAILLCVAIWAFCRAYYFAFYVLERYIDPTYRFAGLMSLLRYVAHQRRDFEQQTEDIDPTRRRPT